jgi:hypothetical protein
MTSATGGRVGTDGWFFDDLGIEAQTVPLVAPYRARVSGTAAFSLILGVMGLAATLTGLLAAAGVALGTMAVVVAVPGLVGIRRRHLTGHSLALLGIVCGLCAAAIGVLAIGGYLSWLSGHSDEVSRLHDWLVVKLPWLGRWQR